MPDKAGQFYDILHGVGGGLELNIFVCTDRERRFELLRWIHRRSEADNHRYASDTSKTDRSEKSYSGNKCVMSCYFKLTRIRQPHARALCRWLLSDQTGEPKTGTPLNPTHMNA